MNDIAEIDFNDACSFGMLVGVVGAIAEALAKDEGELGGASRKYAAQRLRLALNDLKRVRTT